MSALSCAVNGCGACASAFALTRITAIATTVSVRVIVENFMATLSHNAMATRNQRTELLPETAFILILLVLVPPFIGAIESPAFDYENSNAFSITPAARRSRGAFDGS